VRLNRPERGNSFDSETAKELARAFRDAHENPKARVILLGGEGKNFCTGADLDWMGKMGSLPMDENIQDALSSLYELYDAILGCDVPVLGHAHGKVLGGGMGLVAGCDLAACRSDTTFALPEAQLGLVPGTLTPFLIRKIGHARFMDLALTSREISAQEAFDAELVSFIGSEQAVDSFLLEAVEKILSQAPGAVRAIKKSARDFSIPTSENIRQLALLTAERRASPEAKKGKPKKGKSWC
jgi:methylglutaconyl-CoA hydratase